MEQHRDVIGRLNFRFLTLIAAPMVGFVIVFLINDKNPDAGYISSSEWQKNLTILTAFLALAALAHGLFYYYRFFKDFRKKSDHQLSLAEKIAIYKERSGFLYTYLTISSILIVLGYYIIATDVFVVLYAISLVITTRFRPSQGDVTQKMKLSEEEQEVLLEEMRLDQ